MISSSLALFSLLVPLTQVGVDPADLAQAAYLKSTTSAALQLQGKSVCVSGDTMVSCSPMELYGIAHVFVRSGNSWIQEASLSRPLGDSGDYFGSACTIDGDTIVVAAFLDDTASQDGGACYVFERSGTTWSPTACLKAPLPFPTAEGNQFGSSLDLEGDRLLVGAQGMDRVTLFERSAGVWNPVATVQPTAGGFTAESFGSSVSLSGSAMAIGAPAYDGSRGAAYVFREVAGAWVFDRLFVAATPLANGRFGTSVSLSGDTLVVGYAGDRSLASGVSSVPTGSQSSLLVGSAYVFEYSSSWSLGAYLKAEFPRGLDGFGHAVRVCGDVIAVGVVGESSSATGIDGNADDNGAGNSGACYLYQRSVSSWSQLAYIKAAAVDAEDNFGGSVDMDVATLVVGAVGEGSGATMIDGDDSDNSAWNAGAAYAFRLRSFAELSFRNAGSNPASLTVGYPTLGTAMPVGVDLTTTGHPLAVPFGFVQATSIPLGAGRTLLAGNGLFGGELFGLPPSAGPQVNTSVSIPLDTGLAGIALTIQAAHIGAGLPFALSNAYDLVLGF